jgi:hypothetical protein
MMVFTITLQSSNNQIGELENKQGLADKVKENLLKELKLNHQILKRKKLS